MNCYGITVLFILILVGASVGKPSPIELASPLEQGENHTPVNTAKIPENLNKTKEPKGDQARACGSFPDICTKNEDCCNNYCFYGVPSILGACHPAPGQI